MSRRRSLSDEERALWAGFARSIKPLVKRRRAAEPAAADKPDTAEKPAAAKPPAARQGAVEPKRQEKPQEKRQDKKPSAPPLMPLGRRLKQRVARGRDPIEARLDLHGMTQGEAHGALLR